MKQQALMAALAFGATAAPVQGQTQQALQRPTIVLVHGGFVDGSGWERVFGRLRKDGYAVTIVQNPTITLSDDVAATRRAIAADKGESVAKLIANPAPGAPVPPILPPQDGFLLLDRAKFAASFAGDVDAPLAEF